jgi:predicted TIM-barrel fold metal-dependent hydrolase
MLTEVADLALIDHHCHGVVGGDLDRPSFEDLITEGHLPAPEGTSHFDGPLGLAVRRHCAPLLDLEPGADADAYLDRRAALGAEEVNRRLLRASGLGTLLVDTGYRAEHILDPAGMSRLADARAYEVVRLEQVAEHVALQGVAAQAYPDAYRQALVDRTRIAVGLKTIIAYRGGFAIDPSPPSDDEVIAAAGRWFAHIERSRTVRLEDEVLLRFGIWTGVRLGGERRLPLQIHVGLGDPDLTLHLANPSLLTALIRAVEPEGTRIMLLHCYPYHREAGYLAAVFPHVYFDVGLAITYLGPSGSRAFAEALELAPFTKQLYSSDAFGLAELYYLGARRFRVAMEGILTDWTSRGECSPREAERIVQLIGAENARRVYRLGEDG